MSEPFEPRRAPKDRLAFMLTQKILEVVDESGATQEEAQAAMEAALSLMPETVNALKPGWIVCR